MDLHGSVQRYVIETKSIVDPFETPACMLPILNKTLSEHQTSVFREFGVGGDPHIVPSLEEISAMSTDIIVHRDDVYLNAALVSAFIGQAVALKKPARLAFRDNDPSIAKHACYPLTSLECTGNLYLGELYYIPASVPARDFVPVTVDTASVQLPCFSLPLLAPNLQQGLFSAPMASSGIILFPPLTLQVPLRAYVTIEHWVQLLFANFIWGIHCQARQLQGVLKSQNNIDPRGARRHIFKCRGIVHIGANCQIDPTATIIGPTTIGDGVTIGPNVTIAVAHIGNHAVLEPNCTVWLGVLGERSSLLAHNTIVMSCVMNDSIINTNVRFSIVGNKSFLGGGVYLTDRLLSEIHDGDPQMKAPIVKVLANGELVDSGYYILGPCIGNRVRIGSGVIIYPGRMVQSDSLLLAEGAGGYIIAR